jgi:AraC-like DNA-binding protein
MTIFFLLGSLQGIIISLILFYKSIQQQRKPLQWLSLLVALISIHLLYGYVVLNGTVLNFIWVMRLYEPIPFLYSYIIYRFTISLTSAKQNRLFNNVVLLLFFGSFLFLTPFIFSTQSIKILFYNQVKCSNYPVDFKILFLLKSIIGILSLILSIKHLRSYDKLLLEQFSSLQGKSLHWLQWFYFLLLVMWAIATARFFLGFHHNVSIAGAIAITIFIYFISFYTAAYQPVVILKGKDNSEFNIVETEPIVLSTTKPKLLAQNIETIENYIDETERKKYKNSSLTKQDADKIYLTLDFIITTQKLFADKECNLQMVSVAANIKPSLISETLNTFYKTNFYNFINQYRVQEAKLKLNADDSNSFSLEGIGEMCGFKSKSTFYSFFKKETGLTPMEYKKQVKEA